MSGEFPLSVSQRETLAMYTDPDSSDIFAVNDLREQARRPFYRR